MVGVQLQRNLLQVEDDVGRVFDHAGIGENSWSTPSILTAVIAAPSIDDSSTRRSALPIRRAEASLERLGVEPAEPVRQSFPARIRAAWVAENLSRACRCSFR